MSFISLPHEFDSKTGECRGFQIAFQESGDITPVGFVRGGGHLPVDLSKLSENLAATLNGREPLHDLHQTHYAFYERHASGLNFRFRDPDGSGVSAIGAMFTILPGVEMEFKDDQEIH